MPTKKISNITFIMAMQQEAQAIIHTLNLVEKTTILHPKLPMRCFQNTVGELNITLITSGIDSRYHVDNIGSEAATLMTYEAIIKTHPDLIISAGTAGGFAKRGAQIGTIYVSEKHFIFHDRHVPLTGFDESAIGKYPATNMQKMADDLQLKTGVISTGSSLKKFDSDVRIVEEHQAVAKEMEAAGVAWVAMLLDVPMMAIKSITNILDEANKSEDEFIKNFDIASNQLHLKIIDVIDYLQHKTLNDLR